ncbi:MAG: DUF1292 domain-containing protein, partial [Oscillospiraceae bacterium]
NYENPHLIDLFDEDGNKVVFEHLDTIKIDEDEYIVCIPYDDDEDEVTEVAMFKIDMIADDESALSQVIDEDLAENIYAQFQERNADLFDFED